MPPASRPPVPAAAEGAAMPDAATVAEMIAQVAAIQAAGRPDIDALPARLSPSRANDFKQCPRLFYFRTITKLSSPPTEATARGTLTHTACERTFDHPAGERTPELSKSYLKPAWDELTNPAGTDEDAKGGKYAAQNAAGYRNLAPAGSQTEAAILEFAEQMVDQWYQMERVNNFDPTAVPLPDGTTIDGREVHVEAPVHGATLHGYVDRLDSWTRPDGTIAYSVTDYKTGKVPGAGKTYSPDVTHRIHWDSFFQLRIYALLLWEMHQVPVSQLRLVYVATGDRTGGISTMAVTAEIIDRTRAEVRAIWSQITRSARTGTWNPRPSKLCSWCYFAPLCPAYETTAAEAA